MSTDTTVGEDFVYNFADINILKELKRIDGVGRAQIMGSKDYSMRVWLKPDRMNSYNVSADEVVKAIRDQNVVAAPGKTGVASGRETQVLQYVLKYTGKLFEPAQYENIVLRSNPDGSMLKLKDVADIEFGTLEYDMASKSNGKPSASIMIKQRPGSNAQEVIKNIKSKVAELKGTSFPPGMDYFVSYDVSRFLDASIHEVVRTLIEAFILVIIIVYLFLQDFRSTLIPALAVPVALVGTFAFMQLFGFSINLLTLFALVLAIGIVVDNAIVVVEAVHAKMAEKHLDAREATIESMKEMSGAIIAITLVMSAVFVPVAFMSGPVGIFYRQFSITLAISIVISGINALTLTPALCALMLKNTHGQPAKNTPLDRFFRGFNNGYDGISNKYRKLLSLIVSRRMITIGLLLAFCIGTYGINTILPTGFIPTEDQGVINVNVTTPVAATVERTEAVLDEIQKVAAVTGTGGIGIFTLSGYSLITESAGSSYGMAMINLKPWDQRKASVKDIIAEMEQKTKHITDADIQFFPPPTVPGFGNSSGFELRVQDRTGSDDLQKTAEITNQFVKDLMDTPEIASAFSSFDASFPQYMIHVDADIASKKGVSVDVAMSTLQTLIGSLYASNFIRFGQMYKVMVQADPSFRKNPEDILKLYVKNNRGEMVPFSTFIRLERVYGPELLTRYNMYTSAMINGDAAPGLVAEMPSRLLNVLQKKSFQKDFRMNGQV